MWKLEDKECWVLKNWCFWTVVLEKTLESPLECKEIQPVNPKGNQSWILIGKTDAEAEALIPWPPDANSHLIGKYPDAFKNKRQEEKETAEDEMIGWHHQLNGHESEQAPWDGEGQGILACCNPWGHKALDTTEQLKNNKADSKIHTEAQMPRITKPIIKRKNNAGRFILQTPNLLQSYSKLGFHSSSDGKASTCNAGEPGLIPGLGSSPGEGNSNPIQYSCLENSKDREPGGLQSMGLQRVGHDWATNTHNKLDSTIFKQG